MEVVGSSEPKGITFQKTKHNFEHAHHH